MNAQISAGVGSWQGAADLGFYVTGTIFLVPNPGSEICNHYTHGI